MISRWMSPTLAMVLCGAPLAARADDYSQFRIPAHHVMGWDGFLSTNGHRNSSRNESATGTSGSTDRLIQGMGGTSFSWLSDSDPRTTRVFARVAAGLQEGWASNDGAVPSLTFTTSNQGRSSNELWQVFLSHRTYPWAFPLGFTVSAFGTGNYQQSWAHMEQFASDLVTLNSSLQRTGAEQWAYLTSVQDAASVGIGRVRDATGIYDAHVFETRLLETGALTRPLSSDARRRLAEIFYLRADYESFRERPAKSLWGRIEDLLRQDGAVSDSFDAHAIQRAGESALFGGQSGDGLPSSPLARFTGYHVAAVLRDQHSNVVVRNDASNFSQVTLGGTPGPPVTSETHDRLSQSMDQVMAGGEAEYHRPIGPRWQLDVVGQALAPVRKEDSGFQVMTVADGAMLISDRLVARIGWDQNRIVRRDASTDVTQQDSWEVIVSGSASYYLEDHLQLQAGVSDDQYHHRDSLTGSPFVASQRSQQFFLVLTYRFMGSFAAPGLMAAENLAGPR